MKLGCLYLLAVAVLSGGLVAAKPVYQDTGFLQDYPSVQLIYSDYYPMAEWSSLPWPSSQPIVQLVSSKAANGTFYVLTGAEPYLQLWQFQVSSTSKSGSSSSRTRTQSGLEASLLQMSENVEYLLMSQTTLPYNVYESMVNGTYIHISDSDGGRESMLILSPTEIFHCDCPLNVSLSGGGDQLGCVCSDLGSFPSGVLGSDVLSIHDVAEDSFGTFWVATDSGLFRLQWDSSLNSGYALITLVPQVEDIILTAVEVVPGDASLNERIYVGTYDRMWYSISSLSVSSSYNSSIDSMHFNFYWVDGVIDGRITSLLYNPFDESLWIGNDICINRLHRNRTYERVAGPAGLPVTNITSLSMDPYTGAMWSGSWYGAVRYWPSRISDPTYVDSSSTSSSSSSSVVQGTISTYDWSYFYGPRWLPGTSWSNGQNVSSVCSIYLSTAREQSAPAAVIATDFGLSIIVSHTVYLQDKADHYQNITYPRHDMYGQTAPVSLQYYGNLSSWEQTVNDNEGLWTASYLAAQCFRYAATQDPDAKASAWRAFQGLFLLNFVTGVPGLPARCALNQTEVPSNGGTPWYNSTTLPGWIWKGDTSSDEIVGHLMVYPIFYDLVCETQDEKDVAMGLLVNMTNYIRENGFLLLDVTGERTTWGVWAPEYINGNRTWYTERGLNSMQMITWLLSAYRVSKDPVFLQSYFELVLKYGYGENVINEKMTDARDVNFSDDELSFLTYLAYYWTLPKLDHKLLEEEMKLSITRSWNFIQTERANTWNFIYSMSLSESELEEPDAFRLADAVQTLQEWPMSQIDWSVNNFWRRDTLYMRELTRSGEIQIEKLISYAENDIYVWNSNPYEVESDGSGSGFSEDAPFDWLLPYWLGRYLGYISAPM